VAFTAGATGGSAITNYKYSTDAGSTWTSVTPASTASPILITGLTNGVTYDVQIKAVNAAGDGSATGSTAATPYTTPSAPTITGVTSGNQHLSVAFTAGATGGSSITSYTATSSPSISLSVSGSSSPLTVTGTFAADTSYTFQIVAVNANGSSIASSASNSVLVKPNYALSQTFNTSGTYTVPSGKVAMALVGTSAGGAGRGNGPGQTGGGGGGGGAGFSIREIAITPGSSYNVVIAGSGGATSFGNILIANGGSNANSYEGAAGGSVTSNSGVVDFAASANGGTANFNFQNTQPIGNGGNSSPATSNDATIPSYTFGGGGGAGALGAWTSQGLGPYNVGAGGSPRGGSGGASGTSGVGGTGASANGPGGGGGGGGGSGLTVNGSSASTQGPPGNGGAAQILVYIK
jgi:hypothetical protein